MFNLVLDSYSLVGHVLFTACFLLCKGTKKYRNHQTFPTNFSHFSAIVKTNRHIIDVRCHVTSHVTSMLGLMLPLGATKNAQTPFLQALFRF